MRGSAFSSSDWQPVGPPGRLGSLLAATALTGIALVSLVGQLTGGANLPPPLVPPPNLSGAVVLVAPGLEEVLLNFPDPERVRLHPGWERLPEIDRAYTVVLPETAELPRLPLGWEAVSELTIGEWRWVGVATEESGGEADRYDFAEHLNEADVYFEGSDGTRTSCDRWRFGRWSCGLEEWLWVGPTEQVFRGRPEACLWAHPRAGHDLVVRFADVPRGTRVMGRYGLTDAAAEVPDGAPVSLAVRADGAEREFLAENRPGLHTFQLRLGPGPDRLDVELVVRADSDGRRHFCFTGGVQGIGAVSWQGPGDESGEALPEAPADGTGLGSGASGSEGTGDGRGAGTGDGTGEVGAAHGLSPEPMRLQRVRVTPAAPEPPVEVGPGPGQGP